MSLSRYISPKNKELVFDRAKNRCEYYQCWAKNALHTFNIKHILPKSKGGTNDLLNLALSCFGCNSGKRDRTVVFDFLTNENIPLYNPRTHKWERHFKWSNNYLEMIGISNTGRVTIKQLKLNREGVMSLRRLTKMAGEHPPII